MSVSITIRDVPQETRDELAARAARGGRSLQEHVRNLLIESAARVDTEEVLRRIRERKEATRTTLSVDFILDALDADRR